MTENLVQRVTFQRTTMPLPATQFCEGHVLWFAATTRVVAAPAFVFGASMLDRGTSSRPGAKQVRQKAA